MSTRQYLTYYVNSLFPYVWLNTCEYERATQAETRRLLGTFGGSRCDIFIWDIVLGLRQVTDKGDISLKDGSAGNPSSAIAHSIGNSQRKQWSVYFLYDYHRYLSEENIWRYLLNYGSFFQSIGVSFVIVSPVVQIPVEIERYIPILDMDLPDEKELVQIVEENTNSQFLNGLSKEEVARTGAGLTAFEFANALRLSMSQDGFINLSSIHRQKEQIVKKSSGLSIYRSEEGFEAVIGLEVMKNFTKKMVLSGQGKGILILGVPGSGKSQFAKCLGKETGRMTIVMDISGMKDKYVGATEQRTKNSLKVIDAMGDCIVFIDEIEKALAGVGAASNDSGVSQSQGGDILKWMSDRSGGAYIVATANDISRLPHEYLRSGRWDTIFFVDVPNKQECKDLLIYFKNKFALEHDDSVDEMVLEGWTGAEIESLCHKASALQESLRECMRYVTPICELDKDKITNLRDMSKMCTKASNPGIDYMVSGDSRSVNKVNVVDF